MLYKTTPAVALELLSKISTDLYLKHKTNQQGYNSDSFLFDGGSGYRDFPKNCDNLKDLFLYTFQQNFGFDYLDLFDQKGGFRDFENAFENSFGEGFAKAPESAKSDIDKPESSEAEISKNRFQQTLNGGIKKFIKDFIASIDDQVLLTNVLEIQSFLQKTVLISSDLAFVKGQKMAKRALEIAASGGHNIMFIGQPGSGKTLIARSYTSILSKMLEEEILEVTQIYSVAGLLDKQGVVSQRPFRAPHHSCSHIALVGGGSKIKPGEVSLAHRGVLFLDEFPEFDRESIEALRQPLEDGFVQISRASGTVIYPAKFYLIAAANPTPSGFDIDDPDLLNKPQNRVSIARYQAKFSGPIMDRIDIHVEVNRPTKDELNSRELEENSASVAMRVQKARDIQTARFRNYNSNQNSGYTTNNHRLIMSNSEMTLPMIQKFCELDRGTQTLLDNAVDKFKLSARSYMRILKLSRTIADLDGSSSIQIKHLAESLQYRSRFG